MASRYRKYPDVRTPKKGNRSGCKPSEAGNQAVRKSTNDFLTTVFKPIHISEMNSLYSEKNYIYLYNSAKNYADMLGVHFPVSGCARNFDALYDAFNKILPEHEDLTLKAHKNKLQFIITENYDEHILYYTPCCIIDKTENKDLKEIYSSFFSILQSSQGLTTLKEDPIFDILQEEIEQVDSNEKDQWVSLLEEYSTGHIAELFNSICKKPLLNIQELNNAIIHYKAKTEKETLILDLMKEGLKLFKKDSIMNYIRPPLEGNDEYYPVDMYRMMYIVYDSDQVFENIFDWISNEANDQGYEILSSGYLQLTPYTKRKLSHSKFIPRFLNWLNRFCHELYNL